MKRLISVETVEYIQSVHNNIHNKYMFIYLLIPIAITISCLEIAANLTVTFPRDINSLIQHLHSHIPVSQVPL